MTGAVVTARAVEAESQTPLPATNSRESVLREIEQRVLWLAVRMIDVANQRDGGQVKVGGHQASSASMVSLMTALWFDHLQKGDKVAVKPHASPVYHAIKYLIGHLDESYLTSLRSFGGLQAYPSRTKDPDVDDFSTGSVGLGAVAPLFSAVVRRYLDSHSAASSSGRFYSLIGDAELDEGNVWEAVSDPVTSGLGKVTFLIDLNRQSLDRVIPGIHARRIQSFFRDAGWYVSEAKYGRKLQKAIRAPGGQALQRHIDFMSNEQYQQLFASESGLFRETFLSGAAPEVIEHVANLSDDQLFDIATDLGGHDLDLLTAKLRECSNQVDRPSVLFAYTVKGWGLPMAGDPLNHSAMLTETQIDEFRHECGVEMADEWARFPPASEAGLACRDVGRRLTSEPQLPRTRIEIPDNVRTLPGTGFLSTQQAFGRVLAGLADLPSVRERLVTTSPDVAISTNLGGWINKVGVFDPNEAVNFGTTDGLLKWAPGPDGQHIELGIAEMNLFLLLGQLGLAHEHHGQQLLPIGTVYDPFVIRGLDALIYSVYSGARFVIVGTPSGVSLAPEGGAHQSTITPSIGLELPNMCAAEPAFAAEVDWFLCDGLMSLGEEHGESLYLRLSTRPISQEPFGLVLERMGEPSLRKYALAGGYRLIDPIEDNRPSVTIAATGTMLPEAVDAAHELDHEGVTASVIQITSADRLYRSWRSWIGYGTSNSKTPREPSFLHRLVPSSQRQWPVVTVQDGASHSLAWLGSALGVRQIPLGVDQFGESGTIDDLHHVAGISAGHLVNACLLAIT